MTRPLFQGELVRLTAINPETDAETVARWSRDSLYRRLLDSETARPWLAAAVRSEREKLSPKSGSYAFAVRTLDGDRLVGELGIDETLWAHGNAWVWIGIGDRDAWGKGYGTDAMRELLRFAFDELNLERISLNYFEYNERARRLYTRLGFVEEGRVQQFINREGRRWDMIYMGLLREEWEQANNLWKPSRK